ncbi:MAG: hypothetical protein IJ675_08900 [Pseudobutyrivibrio sp.]|nr:hypothetical protein [Pseudobutyrivibrio sp.]
MEDKKLIAALLKVTLQQTRDHHDLENIKITNDGQAQEIAVLEYNSNRSNLIVNITHDSGIMMIKDIINAVEL